MNAKSFPAGILILGLALAPVPGTQAAGTRTVVEGNTAFALDLYAQLKTSPGNLFFSPYSISTALAMTYAGARGNTERQMAQVLHFGPVQGPPHAAFGELQRQLGEAGKQEGIELSIANALWAQKGHPFLPGFLNVARTAYSANVNQADFKTQAEAARREINGWAAQRTKDKIKEILPPGSLNDLTRLVLANAVYFKGRWEHPYRKAGTAPQPFFLARGSLVQVPLMSHLEEVGYMEESGFQAVELPYKGGQLSMVILLPRQVDGCGRLQDRLTPALISRALSQMRHREVLIFLPRFKLESSLRLNDTLAKMGMPEAFEEAKADFSGMDGQKLLYISGVFHKAWGEVNEEGTEAAAVTAVNMTSLSAVRERPPPQPVFRADHPFIFLIRDRRSGTVLFLGRLANPSK